MNEEFAYLPVKFVDPCKIPTLGPADMLDKCWEMCSPDEKRAFLDRVRKGFLKQAVRVDETKANILAHEFGVAQCPRD